MWLRFRAFLRVLCHAIYRAICGKPRYQRLTPPPSFSSSYSALSKRLIFAVSNYCRAQNLSYLKTKTSVILSALSVILLTSAKILTASAQILSTPAQIKTKTLRYYLTPRSLNLTVFRYYHTPRSINQPHRRY